MPRTTDSRTSPTPTRRLAELAGEWVLPFWLERQTDPAGPDVASSGDEDVVNLTHRERTPVGTLGSARVATVDPRGLVTPRPGGWSLDWWVGADDRWHLPSREVAVRQSLVGDAPVVETSMRVPGGDVIERVWAFHDVGAGDVLAVEIENASKVPVAIALSLRPYGPDGAAVVERVEVADRTVRVDGRVAVWLPGDPARLAASSRAGGDVAAVVVRGDAADVASVVATCDEGLAQAALIVPLAHTAAIRVLIPLEPATTASMPEAVPPADAVARGWQSHAGRGTRVELPEPEVAATFAAARARVLLAAAGRSLASGDVRTTAAVVRALDRCGLHDEADAIVATLPAGQGTGARLGGADPSSAATGAALHAAGSHWQLGRDAGLVDAIAGPLAAGAHHRPSPGRFGRGGDAPLDATGRSWQLAGARRAADALRAVGQREAADEIDRRVADLVGDQVPSIGLGLDLGPATAGPELLSLLDAVVPLGVVPAAGEGADALCERIRTVATQGPAVLRRGAPFGLSPERTARLAQVELRRGERVALERLRWLVEAAGPTRTWPDLVHPRHGGGSGGAGWSVGATAAFVELVTDLFAVVADDGTLVLCPVLPDEWLGAGFEVHGLATEVGVVSYAVRWHGERPAVLWELSPHPGVGEVRITSPGLDPAWSTTDLRGDALLGRPPSAPVTEPGPVEADAVEPGPAEGESFG